MISRYSEIYDHLLTLDNFNFNLNSESSLGTPASKIASDLNLNRANTSRILNNLHQDGKVLKINSRPVLFITCEILKKYNISNYKLSYSSISEFQNLIHSLHPPFDLLPPLKFIGCGENESLHTMHKHLYRSLIYPSGGLNILVCGEQFTNKSYLIHQVSNYYALLNRISSEYILKYNCYGITIDDLKDSLDSFIKKDDSSVILILQNLNNLIDENSSKLQRILTNFTDLCNGKLIILATSNESPCDSKDLSSIKGIFPTITHTTPYSEKSVKEKALIVLHYFQNETNQIKMPITLKMDIINCFIAASYSSNYKSIENEVKHAVSTVYSSSISNHTRLLNLTFDDLSDDLLNSITSISNLLKYLDNLKHVIGTDTLLFIPDTENIHFTTLFDTPLSQSQFMSLSKVHSTNSLSDLCDSFILKSNDLELTMIKSIQIKNLYDLVYPLIHNHPLAENEKLLYTLLSFLYKTIDDLDNQSFSLSCTSDENLSRTSNSYRLSSKIAKVIDDYYKVSLPLIVHDFISIFLERCKKLSSKSDISLLIITHGEHTADEFLSYVKKMNYTLDIHSLNYSEFYQKQNFNVFKNVICEKIQQFTSSSKLILLTDIDPLTTLDKSIFSITRKQSYTISPVSIAKLIEVINFIEQESQNFNDIKNYFHYYQPSLRFHDEKKVSFTSDSYINKIYNHILKDSLLFLDFYKAKDSFMLILENIATSLSLPLSENLISKFIIHTSFCLERSIKNEPLTIKKVNNFIKGNPELYRQVEKEFELIEATFGCSISPSELVLICQIFQNQDES